MNKIKIAIVFGTRPELIKLIPVIKEGRRSKNIVINLVFVEQHPALVSKELKLHNIKPDQKIKLNIQKNVSLTEKAAEILHKLGTILKNLKPDLTLVHGDTLTAGMTALSCGLLKLKLAHIEAGLRTYDKMLPFPEEMIRQSIARFADLHFCPTDKSVQNLVCENIPIKSIHKVGNTIVDYCNEVKSKLIGADLAEVSVPAIKIKNKFDYTQRFILVTIHRRENISEKFEEIRNMIQTIARDFPDVIFCVVRHPNPMSMKLSQKLKDSNKNIILIDPVDSIQFHILISKCLLIISDSGGIQEEAPCYGKNVMLLREATERPEGIATGHIKIVGYKYSLLKSNMQKVICGKTKKVKTNPYGDGKAAKRIVKIISKLLLS